MYRPTYLPMVSNFFNENCLHDYPWFSNIDSTCRVQKILIFILWTKNSTKKSRLQSSKLSSRKFSNQNVLTIDFDTCTACAHGHSSSKECQLMNFIEEHVLESWMMSWYNYTYSLYIILCQLHFKSIQV